MNQSNYEQPLPYAISGISDFDRSLEVLHGFETDLVRIIYYDIPHHLREDYRSYEYNRVCAIIEGEKHVSVNSGETFTYGRDEFMILPPESTIDMEIEKPTRALALELSDHLIENISRKICPELEIPDSFINSGTIYRDSAGMIDDDLGEIASTAMGNTQGREFLVDLHIQKMVCTLLRNMGSKEILLRHPKNPITISIDIMRTHYAEGITLAEVAHAVGMSTSLFSINFKKITGITPGQYFTNIKLDKARDLLRDLSVTEVSFELGYENISYFIRVFREKFGITPKQYQLHNFSDCSVSL